jgi:hypothetical protein
MNRTLSPELVPVKQAVRAAVSLLGGIDGVVPIVERTRSTVGRWVNINDADMPPLDAAVAIDQALTATGQKPLIAAQMARVLGATLLPNDSGDGGDLASNILLMVGRLAKEGGEVQSAIIDGVQAGMDKKARDKVRNEIADVRDLLALADKMLIAGVA